MNPNIIAVLLHIGGVIKAVKDIEKGIQDAIHGDFKADDLKAVLDDVLSLISGGVLSFPGMTKDELAAVIADLQKAL